MGDSKIEYVTKTWSPVTGCSPVSAGCAHCWAAAYHRRWKKNFAPTFHPERLAEPLRWRKPQRVAGAFLGDLFHKSITDVQIAAVFGVMAACPQHDFFLATKRAARMPEWFQWLAGIAPWSWSVRFCRAAAALRIGSDLPCRSSPRRCAWPLSNVWVGCSVEDQARTDERLPELMATPAAHRWVSLEPCIGPVNLSRWLGQIGESGAWTGFGERLDWLVVGGESSQGGQPARPCDVAWIRSVVEQFQTAGVPVYTKQLGSHVIDRGKRLHLEHPRGADPEEWPADLRVRELPAGFAAEAKS